MIHAFTVEQIRAAEAQALARTGDEVLMRRAAAEVAVAVTDRLAGRVTGRSAVLLVGGGNNGGDALFAGALLRRRGMAVTAVLTDERRAHAGGLAELRRRRGRVLDMGASGSVHPAIATADVIVDGLVGLGGRPPLRPVMAALVAQANDAAADRVAVDLPSGLDPDTGVTDGVAFRADCTVTFGGMKSGLLVADGYAGTVIVAGLGMEPADSQATVGALTDLDVAELMAAPGTGDDKFSSGVLGVVAGSVQYPGAAVLAVGGAVRLRPGMVRYAGPQAAAVVARWPEVVAADDPARSGQVQAWVAGPGMGTDEAALRRLETVVAAPEPVLIDADGLTLLSEHPDLLRSRRDRTTVLTPHDREFARLFPDLALTDRLTAVRAAAAASGAVVLLKGHRTLVATPSGAVTVNTTGSGWLATAGSGDVLSGVIGSLLAAGLPAHRAAAAGAHLHGRAGERAAADRAAGAQQLWDRLRPAT